MRNIIKAAVVAAVMVALAVIGSSTGVAKVRYAAYGYNADTHDKVVGEDHYCPSGSSTHLSLDGRPLTCDEAVRAQIEGSNFHDFGWTCTSYSCTQTHDCGSSTTDSAEYGYHIDCTAGTYTWKAVHGHPWAGVGDGIYAKGAIVMEGGSTGLASTIHVHSCQWLNASRSSDWYHDVDGDGILNENAADVMVCDELYHNGIIVGYARFP